MSLLAKVLEKSPARSQMSGGIYGITEVETRAFENLKAWLTENHGTIDMEAIQNNGQLVRAEKKAIMAILLSLDPNEYIFDYWSMGTFVRIILDRLLVFGRLLLESKETGSTLEGPDIFSGETHGHEHTEAIAFAETESGEKREYLGSLNSWAYHIILNGATHPATREPIKSFSFKSLDQIKSLPKALRLSRSERLTLNNALKAPRTEPPQISRDQVLAFEYEFSVPADRSFYDLHHEDDDMPPLIHAVPNSQAHYIPVYLVHNNTFYVGHNVPGGPLVAPAGNAGGAVGPAGGLAGLAAGPQIQQAVQQILDDVILFQEEDLT